MKPTLTRLWFNDLRPSTKFCPEPTVEIRVDWSNDRHHAAKIEPPYGKEQVTFALNNLKSIIHQDKYLNEAKKLVDPLTAIYP